MYQLRIYTLRTSEALEDYATAHWPRHIHSLRAFGVTTLGIWTDHNADAHRLIALISYPEAADPAAVTAAYMASPEFKADMDGFDISNITNVEEILLDPTAASPLP
jgi:NIPSNAP